MDSKKLFNNLTEVEMDELVEYLTSIKDSLNLAYEEDCIYKKSFHLNLAAQVLKNIDTPEKMQASFFIFTNVFELSKKEIQWLVNCFEFLTFYYLNKEQDDQ